MFETSQPNHERSKDSDSSRRFPEREQRTSGIKTLEQLSNWIDAQLIVLEERFKEFETKQSLRGYYDRSRN